MNRQLAFLASCDMGEYLIAVDERGKYLFEIEKKSGKSKCVAELEHVGDGQSALYECAERYNDKIFFFPFSINNAPIIAYYFIEQKVEYINLNEKSNLVNGEYQFVQRVDDSIWIFPVSLSSDLLVFNMSSGDITTISTWRSAVSAIQLDYDDHYSKVGAMVEAEGALYQTVVKTNMVIEIIKKDYKVNVYALPEAIKLHRSIDYDGHSFWIPDMQNNVVEWNLQQGIKNIFHINVDKKTESYMNPRTILCGKNYIWLFPYQQDDRIIQINNQTGENHIIDIFPGNFKYDTASTRAMFGQMHKNGSIIDIYPFNGNLVIHFDLEHGELLERYEKITLPEEWSDKQILEYELQSQRESNRISPSYFLDAYLETVQYENKVKNNQMCGQKIWKYLAY